MRAPTLVPAMQRMGMFSSSRTLRKSADVGNSASKASTQNSETYADVALSSNSGSKAARKGRGQTPAPSE